jgi:class 3 adenylate cyclase
LFSEVLKLEQFAHELPSALRNDHAVRLRNALQARRKVRRLPNDGLLLGSARSDQITDDHQPCCDVVGSTALSARMDPEDLREVISAYQKCVAETVQRFGGFVAKFMGDGVLVYFGYPQAHEDDAERAVRAGLKLVAAVSDLKTHAALQTRIGTIVPNFSTLNGPVEGGKATDNRFDWSFTRLLTPFL